MMIPSRMHYRRFPCIVLAVAWASCLGSVQPVVTLAEDLLFKRHVINDQTDYSAAALIDVNHDGVLDIVCGGDWYEGPTWKRHFVADIPRIGGRPDGFSHLAFDVNRDGWDDVITVNYRSRSIKWLEHPGKALGPWTIHTAVEPGPMETGRLVDIDGDGKLDLLPNGANFAAWWEFRWNSENAVGEPAWIRHDLPEEAGGHGLGFGDINGDGRGDIVGQNGWLEAPEDVRTGRWKWHADYRIERGSIPMLVADPDEDGDSDILWCSAHGYGVYWHEQSQDANGDRNWTRHAIDTSWSQGHSPLWADMDGDGKCELITGKRYMAHGGADPGEYDPIAAFRYEFDKSTRSWRRWTMSPVGDRVGMGLDPKIGDIDGDGDLDLLTSGRSGLYWLENLGPGDSSKLESELPHYDPNEDLLSVRRGEHAAERVEEPEGWGLRRYHIVGAIEQSHGKLPDSNARVPLDMQQLTEAKGGNFATREVRYRIDDKRRGHAKLWIPDNAKAGETNAMLCIFEASQAELAERVAQELVSKGFVCMVTEFKVSDGSSDISDAVWQAMRAVDALQACDQVHGEKIGYVGNALNGQLGLYLAALDQRILVSLTDASGAASLVSNDEGRPYSLAELLAATAPRSLNLVLPQEESLAASSQQAAERASDVYELRRVPQKLQLSQAALDSADRTEYYAWLENEFRPRRFGFSRPAPESTNREPSQTRP